MKKQVQCPNAPYSDKSSSWSDKEEQIQIFSPVLLLYLKNVNVFVPAYGLETMYKQKDLKTKSKKRLAKIRESDLSDSHGKLSSYSFMFLFK